MKQWLSAAIVCGATVGVAELAAATPHAMRPIAEAAGAYPALANFNATHVARALGSELQARRMRRSELLEARAGRPYGHRSSFDAGLGVPSFVWAGADSAPAAVGALKPKAMAAARARDFLRRQAELLGVRGSDVDDARLVEVHDVGRGPVIARFAQRYQGVDVFSSRLNVMMTREGRLVATSGHFAPDLDLAGPGGKGFGGSASAALGKAFADMGGHASGAFSALGDRGAYTRYARPASEGPLVLQKDPRAKRVYFPRGDALVPAYYLELSAADARGHAQSDFAYVVSADGAEILFRKNLTEYASFSYRVWADADAVAQPFDEPIGNGYAPYVSPEVPTSGATQRLVGLESSALISTGDPWLAAGATETVGNNVNAYLDIDPYKGQLAGVFGGPTDGYQPDLGDLRPTVSSAASFDYPIAAYADPSTDAARKSAAVNLFFVNNWLHDFWYDRGFDEAAGNAQTDNYSRGGVAGDPINAEGQDGSGRNNANMLTPADGDSPRMQMFLFDGPVLGEMTVSSSAEPLEFSISEWDPAAFEVSGQVVLALDGTSDTSASTTDACDPLTNAAALAGKVAILDRGVCNFEFKAQQVEEAGALAAIIINNVEGAPITMAESDDAAVVATIPTVMISLDDGTAVKAALEGGTVTTYIRRDLTVDLDGTIDNGVVAHEFFHYVSNRLVNDGSGLDNTQGRGMGEGWSDFNTLLLSVRPEDADVGGNAQYQGAYPVGVYVIPDMYFGIRRAPYSTDFAINPLTFQHIENGVPLPTTAPFAYGQDGASNAEVHNSGEVWTAMLWQGYAEFLNDSRYSFEEARERMQEYLIAGLKMTPQSPTFVEARDAVVAAALASGDYLDFVHVSKGFAIRGNGVGAVAPERTDANNAGVVESYVVADNTAPVADAGADQLVPETVDGAASVVALSGSASDIDSPEGLASVWTQLSGTSVALIDADSASPSFTAPDVAADETLVFELTVTDPVGATGTDTVSVTIGFVSQTPTADAGEDVTVEEGASVALVGTASDPDGDEGLTYAWTQASGASVEISGADTLTPSFTAPDVAADSVLEFTLTVTDPSGASASDTVSVSVTAKADGGGDDDGGDGDGDGGSGSFGWLTLLGLGVPALLRRRRETRRA